MSKESHRFERLTQKEVINQIEVEKKDVIKDLNKLGIDTSQLDFHCQIKPVFEEDLVSSENEENSDVDSDFEESYELTDTDFYNDEHDDEVAELHEGAELQVYIFLKYCKT